jgi:hypothetical protein
MICQLSAAMLPRLLVPIHPCLNRGAGLTRHVYAICPIIKISLIVDVPSERMGSGDNEGGFFLSQQLRSKHTLLVKHRKGSGTASHHPTDIPAMAVKIAASGAYPHWLYSRQALAS